LIIIIIIIIIIGNLGRKISSSSGDDREGALLFQRVSVLVQRFNAVLLHDSLPTPDCTDLTDLYPILYFSIFKFPREHVYQGSKNNNNFRPTLGTEYQG